MSLAAAQEEVFSPLLRHLGVRSDALFKTLIEAHPYPERAFVLEVGGRDAGQSMAALKRGFTTHVWEPSPASNQRISRALGPWITNGTAQVHAEAASSRSGLTVPFRASRTFMSAAGDSIVSGTLNNRSRSTVIEVPTVALDQSLASIGIEQAFFVKIDVQGHEAHVLKGLSRSLSRHAFDYVMFEWWPSAMDQPEHRLPGAECTGAEALRQVARAGYALFELQVKSRHYAETEVPLQPWQTRTHRALQKSCQMGLPRLPAAIPHSRAPPRCHCVHGCREIPTRLKPPRFATRFLVPNVCRRCHSLASASPGL